MHGRGQSRADRQNGSVMAHAGLQLDEDALQLCSSGAARKELRSLALVSSFAHPWHRQPGTPLLGFFVSVHNGMDGILEDDPWWPV